MYTATKTYNENLRKLRENVLMEQKKRIKESLQIMAFFNLVFILIIYLIFNTKLNIYFKVEVINNYFFLNSLVVLLLIVGLAINLILNINNKKVVISIVASFTIIMGIFSSLSISLVSKMNASKVSEFFTSEILGIKLIKIKWSTEELREICDLFLKKSRANIDIILKENLINGSKNPEELIINLMEIIEKNRILRDKYDIRYVGDFLYNHAIELILGTGLAIGALCVVGIASYQVGCTFNSQILRVRDFISRDYIEYLDINANVPKIDNPEILMKACFNDIAHSFNIFKHNTRTITNGLTLIKKYFEYEHAIFNQIINHSNVRFNSPEVHGILNEALEHQTLMPVVIEQLQREMAIVDICLQVPFPPISPF